MFNTQFKDVEDYIDFQKNFRSHINKDEEVNLDLNKIYCFEVKDDYDKNTFYSFINTNNELDIPPVFYYSSGLRSVGQIRSDQFEKIGLHGENNDFIAVVNNQTNFNLETLCGRQ